MGEKKNRTIIKKKDFPDPRNIRWCGIFDLRKYYNFGSLCKETLIYCSTCSFVMGVNKERDEKHKINFILYKSTWLPINAKTSEMMCFKTKDLLCGTKYLCYKCYPSFFDLMKQNKNGHVST